MEYKIKYTPLHDDLIDYYQDGNLSFQGWLLTLNDEEFASMRNILTEQHFKGEKTVYAKLYLDKGIFSQEAEDPIRLVTGIIEICLSCTIIALYKDKTIRSISRGSDDADWVWEMTDGNNWTFTELIDRHKGRFRDALDMDVLDHKDL